MSLSLMVYHTLCERELIVGESVGMVYGRRERLLGSYHEKNAHSILVQNSHGRYLSGMRNGYHGGGPEYRISHAGRVGVLRVGAHGA